MPTTSAPEPSTRIHISPPDVTKLEEEAALRAVRSGWLAPLGPEVDQFEAELADFSERRYCIALSSGTAALHLALLALGVGKGDIVLTSSMTFAATTNAIVYTGARPVLVDADATGNINPELLRSAVEDLTKRGLKPRMILPVDLFGKVADHSRIAAVAANYEIPVLSDAAESLGSRLDARPSTAFGRAAAVSFNGNKIITTSGGGAILTDDAHLAERVRYLSTQARQPAVHYEHRDVGYNYRLSNILAAVGRAQLSRISDLIAARRRNRSFYIRLLDGVPGVRVFGEPSTSADGATTDNCWLTSVVVEPDIAGFTRNHLMNALTQANIESRPLWKPMHLQPIYKHEMAYVDGTSQQLFENGLSLPSGSALTSAERLRIAETLNRAVTLRHCR